MNRKGQIELILLFFILLGLICTVAYGMFLYDNQHPCLEYKEYCYYTQSSSGVGITGGGDVAFVSGSTKVYTDCNNSLAPNIQREKRCERRS